MTMNIKEGIITESELVQSFGSQSQKKSFYEKRIHKTLIIQIINMIFKSIYE